MTKLSRLKRIAEHDVHNRDTAILYVDGKFYEDVSHSACYTDFLNDTDYDDENLDNQYRPDIKVFTDLSKNVGPVALAHRVDKEGAVYLIYGIIDGNYASFSEIPDNIISDFKNHYNLEVRDEMTHSDKEENKYDPDEQWQKAHKRIDELNGENGGMLDTIEAVESIGYFLDDKTNCWINSETECSVQLNIDDNVTLIHLIGKDPIRSSNKKLIEKLKSLDLSLINKLKQMKDFTSVPGYLPGLFIISFVNNNGINIKLTADDDRIKLNKKCDFKNTLYELIDTPMNLKDSDIDMLIDFAGQSIEKWADENYLSFSDSGNFYYDYYRQVREVNDGVEIAILGLEPTKVQINELDNVYENLDESILDEITYNITRDVDTLGWNIWTFDINNKNTGEIFNIKCVGSVFSLSEDNASYNEVANLVNDINNITVDEMIALKNMEN